MAIILSNEPIRLEQSDLFSPEVDRFIEERSALRKATPEADDQSLLVRVLYSSWFYLSIACGIGAGIAWACLEPFFNDGALAEGQPGVAEYLLFPTVGGAIGLFLGATEGLICRNFRRALVSGAVGLGIGFGGGIIALIPTGLVFVGAILLMQALPGHPVDPGVMPTGFSLLALIMGRGAAWAIAATPAGLGQGVAVGEKKVILNGVLGGLLGGLIGGLMFDPISLVLTTADGEAAYSRAAGLTVIGLSVGLFVGLVDQWTKTAWLLMHAGPLAGKQFVLYRNPTVLGSSPKADVYLFKDDAIEPRHALIHNRGGRFEIEDCNTPDGTYVNGHPVHNQMLRSGDQIVLGKTVLVFQLKDS